MDLRRRFGRGDAGADDQPEAEAVPRDPAGSGPDPEMRTSEVISQSFDAMQSLITRYRLAALPPDVLVTVPLSAARTLDFHRAVELIELGRTLAAAALDDAGR
jgi:NTE family protein